MYSEKLESIIDAIVEEGSLDESSFAVLKNAAIKDGEDPDEVCIIVKGRIAKAKKAVSSVQPTATPSNKIGGPAKKCPACGADYIPGTAVCPECGYVFSGIGASSSAEKLYNRLQEFNNQNRTKSDGGMMSAFLKMYHLSDDGTGDIARRKMDLIQSFPVPNNREDLFDFLTSLQPKADINGPKTGVKGGGIPGSTFGKQKTEDLSYAYWLLFSNCINKAKISFPNDKDFSSFFEFYDKLTSSSKSAFNIFKKK